MYGTVKSKRTVEVKLSLSLLRTIGNKNSRNKLIINVLYFR